MEKIYKKLLLSTLTAVMNLSAYSALQIIDDPTRIQKMSGSYIDDVLIYPRNIVEVVGTVFMGEGKKIIVSKGAILKIDGQIITTMNKKCSNCDYKGETKLWDGILVLGDPAKSQEIEHKLFCNNKLSLCFQRIIGPDGNIIYTNSNPRACLGHTNQGMVYCKNSLIEYSNYGIVAGTVPTVKVPMFNKRVPLYGSLARVDGGGLLIIEDSEFKNNRYGSIMFADYSSFEQLSHVVNNKIHLTGDFISQFALGTGKDCRFVAMSLNNFKFNISGNTLTCELKSGHYPMTGFYLVQSNVKLRSNLNISNLHKGISANAYTPGFNMGSSTINYNVLSSNNIGIHLQGVDKMNVNFNTLVINGNNSVASNVIKFAEKDHGYFVQASDLLTNNALGTYMDGAFNLSYNKNVHQFGSSNSLNRTWGVFFNNANNSSGYVKNNTFNGLYNASFFNSGNNNHVNVLCNKYNSTFSDLVVENIKNTGIRNIGTYASPAGNTFQPTVKVNTCVTMESVRNEYLGTIMLNYYHQSNVNNTKPIETYSVKLNSSVKLPNCFENYSEPIANVPCDGPVIVKPNDKKAQYLIAQENYSFSKLRFETNESSEKREDCVFYRSLYDQSLADLLNHYAESSLLDSINKALYRDSIGVVLQGHQTFAGKYYLTQFYLESKYWSEALGVLAQLERTDAQDSLVLQYCEYMKMIIDFASNNFDADWLKNHFEEIKAVADEPSHMMSAKAKVLVQMAAETDIDNGFHDSVLYSVKLPLLLTTQDSIHQKDSMDLLIYPNPVSQYLNVVLDHFVPESKTYLWEIVDPSGTILKTGELVFNMEAVAAVKLDISTLESDRFYYFKLMDGVNCVKSASFKKI